MKTLEEQLHDAGLTVSGCCEHLSAYGDDLLHNAPLLQDMTMAEADILGASMLLIRAEPGQVLIREGDSGDWMLLLKGTVDVTKRIKPRTEDAPADAGKQTSTQTSKQAHRPAPPPPAHAWPCSSAAQPSAKCPCSTASHATRAAPPSRP